MLISVGLVGLLVLALFTLLHIDVPFAGKATSQIYIHGTPVCVTQRPHGILAQVGECDPGRISPHGEYSGEVPVHGHRGRDLPPGHPPIDGNLFPEGNRRVLI
ncbi:MAG: hypothetical protein Kow00128_06210 [Deltaproteobacteria bacterium]